MVDSVWSPALGTSAATVSSPPRHSFIVRLTHWLTTLCFLALLVTGIELVISHPRFYWGETGNTATPALFQIPIPASRGVVKTGYKFVLPDQNGWSRALHFQAAWLAVFTALLYGLSSFLNGHFRKQLFPAWDDLSLPAFVNETKKHLRFQRPTPTEERSYNLLQRLSYISVIFILFPLIIWTGLAMSPGFTAAFPFIVDVFGGHQSARTIHFFVTLLLALFVITHVAMVIRAGFKRRMRAMIIGNPDPIQEQS